MLTEKAVEVSVAFKTTVIMVTVLFNAQESSFWMLVSCANFENCKILCAKVLVN